MRLKKFLILFLFTFGCVAPRPGSDKEGLGRLMGAISGAGTGAVTGFQLGAGTGPGAAVGAGVGSLVGGVRGIVQDQLEGQENELKGAIREAEGQAQAQKIIAHFYNQRVKWHPSRDLYPADVFFDADMVVLNSVGNEIVKEFGRLNQERFPWSRFGVVVYNKSQDPFSSYARHLSEKRAQTVANNLIKAGIEPRRVEAHGVLVKESVFVEPNQLGDRYAQAIEFIPLDR